jgi:DNA-binding response OmpR family regulator
MKILVVHRQKSTVGVIMSVLSESKSVVLQTESGLDGLLTSRIEHFDLIICGTDLPVVTGFELIRSLRTSSVNQYTAVVFLCDELNNAMEQLGRALGAEAMFSPQEIAYRLPGIVEKYTKVNGTVN